MKKVLLVAAVAAFVMTSCKKDYTCECTTTSPAGTTTASGKTGKMKKKDAESKCNEGDATYTFFGDTYTTDCKIK